MKELLIYIRFWAFFGVLASYSDAQQPMDILKLMLRTVIDNQDELLSKFEDSTRSIQELLRRDEEAKKEVKNITDKLESLQTTLTSLDRKNEETKEELNDMRDKMSTLQTTLTSLEEKDNVVQNITATTQRMLQDFLEQRESERNESKMETTVQDCKELLDVGKTESGVYKIYPDGFSEGVDVYCDQLTDGGGWTVILRRLRQIPQLNFSRYFEEYAQGFGDPKGELWIGNRILHSLTNDKNHTLKVEAKNLKQESRDATWGLFSVSGEDTQFTLTVGNYYPSSTLGDGLSKAGTDTQSNNMKFSTLDNYDEGKETCLKSFKGGWWYGNCYGTNPTSPLGDEDKSAFANWWFWQKDVSGTATAVFEIQFKIRSQ